MLSSFESYSDEELCALSQQGQATAEEELVNRYQRSVRMISRPYFLAGGDTEDLIQEAMVGLLKAIREFDPSRKVSFSAFAEVCIRNRIRSAITSAARDKHAPLNDSVPLDSSLPLCTDDPEDGFISREAEAERLDRLKNLLSPLERDILELFLRGLSYREIGVQVRRPVKSVDNAVQRIRRKVAGTLGDYSES